MTGTAQGRLDGRSHDVITAARSKVEGQWMDGRVLTFEARRENARAFVAVQRGQSPVAHIIATDERLLRLEQYHRQRAAEAAGITFISPDQMPLFDGCGPDGRSA